MKKELINYDTIVQVTKNISMSKDPEEMIFDIVKSVRGALDAKGCALFLVSMENRQLELVASAGLSEDYLNKGPISAIKSIAGSLQDGPVAISDVMDDPRIQYPEEAQKEGIASILSVPIFVKGDVIGAMRVYSEETWEITLEDVNFVQALAQISGLLIDMCRLYEGQNEVIDILTKMRESIPL